MRRSFLCLVVLTALLVSGAVALAAVVRVGGGRYRGRTDQHQAASLVVARSGRTLTFTVDVVLHCGSRGTVAATDGSDRAVRLRRNGTFDARQRAVGSIAPLGRIRSGSDHITGRFRRGHGVRGVFDSRLRFVSGASCSTRTRFAAHR